MIRQGQMGTFHGPQRAFFLFSTQLRQLEPLCLSQVSHDVIVQIYALNSNFALTCEKWDPWEYEREEKKETFFNI